KPHAAVFAFAAPVEVGPGEEVVVELRHRSTAGTHNIGRFHLALTDEVGPAVHSVEPPPLEQLAGAPAADPEALPAPLRARLLDQFLAGQAAVTTARETVERARLRLGEVKKGAGKVNVMVLKERAEPRQTHVLVRGVWDKKGDAVSPGVPA